MDVEHCVKLDVLHGITFYMLDSSDLLDRWYQLSQRHAIISSIRCAQASMYMKFLWLGVGQEDTRVVIKLDHNRRILDAVVEWIFIAVPSYPREICLLLEG